MFSVFIAAVAVAVFVMYFRQGKQRKVALRTASARPIAKMPEDTQGRIVGVTRMHLEQLTAPLSGTPCVYYSVLVERCDSPASVPAHKQIWREVASETGSVVFLIEDETGRALVDPTAAKIDIQFERHDEMGVAELAEVQRDMLARHEIAERDVKFQLTASQWEFLARHPVEHPGLLRFSEAVIALGEAVAVIGAGVREPDPGGAPSADSRGEPPTRLRFAGSALHPLSINDNL